MAWPQSLQSQLNAAKLKFSTTPITNILYLSPMLRIIVQYAMQSWNLAWLLHMFCYWYAHSKDTFKHTKKYSIFITSMPSLEIFHNKATAAVVINTCVQKILCRCARVHKRFFVNHEEQQLSLSFLWFGWRVSTCYKKRNSDTKQLVLSICIQPASQQVRWEGALYI